MKIKSFPVNRVLACLTAMFIFILSVNFSSDVNDVNAVSTARTYNRYNAVTGAYLGNYTLEALPTNNNTPRTPIGSDDRVVDFTKSGVVKIMNTDSYLGSGFVVDKHTIATAGHCLWDNLSYKANKISEIRLFDSKGNVSKRVTPVESHVPQKYINDSQDSVNYDYGLITVKEDLSDYACFDLGTVLDSGISKNVAVSVTGFPQYYNNVDLVNTHIEDKMYTGSGVLKYKGDVSRPIGGKPKIFYHDSAIFYTADSSGGNSGGPVYITTSYKGEVYYTVIGIHNYGLGSVDVNSATRMTPDLLQFYLRNSHA